MIFNNCWTILWDNIKVYLKWKLYSKLKIFHKNKRKLPIFPLDYLSEIKDCILKVCTINIFHDHCSSRLSKGFSLTFKTIWPFQELKVKYSVTLNWKLLLHFFMVFFLIFNINSVLILENLKLSLIFSCAI